MGYRKNPVTHFLFGTRFGTHFSWCESACIGSSDGGRKATDPEHLVARREFEAKPENRIIVQETLERARPVVAAMTGGSRTVSVSKGCLPRARRILDALARLSALVRVP